MLYKITYEKIHILKRNQDYNVIGDFIIFKNLLFITKDDLGDVLINAKEGFVTFSTNYQEALMHKEKINDIMNNSNNINKKLAN